MLLLTFVIAYFILNSQNYQTLMNYYIEQEVKLHRAQKRQAKLQNNLGED